MTTKAELREEIEALRKSLASLRSEFGDLRERSRRDHALLQYGILPAVNDALPLTGGELQIDMHRETIQVDDGSFFQHRFVPGLLTYDVTYRRNGVTRVNGVETERIYTR